ncbi:MerR family transcriptional regulator [Spirillospora sp. NPDC048819]|uniref:MerR family transcriptional regulator n=1 Tax=Spirillospora sp. NPDC048819 TaxID=3155268 RepID=UPI0033E04DAC
MTGPARPAVTGPAVTGGPGASGGLRSGQVAEAAGVNLQTLRYYERRGLLADPGRMPGGHRLYPAEAVTLLRVIKTAQRLGFTLEEVAELLDAGTHRHRRADAGLQARAGAKLAEVEAKIADLRTIADTLRRALDAGCDDLVTCAGERGCPLPFADLAAGPGAMGTPLSGQHA